MSLWELILRSLAQRRLSAILTAASVALGVMLVTAILLLQQNLEKHFREPGQGYSLVTGAPGSSLQLVLNGVYHLEQSPGLMPFSLYEELRDDPSVSLAVPYAVGDSFRGYRVVGTTEAFFHPRFPHPSGDEKLAAGRTFRVPPNALASALGAHESPDTTPEEPSLGSAQHHEDEHHEDERHEDERHEDEHHGDEHHEDEHHGDEHHGDEHHEHTDVYEAVLGAEVAATLGIRLGDRIEPAHGVDESATAHDHEHLWTVVGILAPSGTAVDRLVLINLDSFYRIPDHEGAVIPGTTEAALSTVLVFPRGGVHKAMLLSRLRRRPDIQVASVSDEVDKLFSIIGNIDVLFLAIAILVVITGVLSVLVSIYNTMNSRRREIAIMRAIGAKRRFIMSAIIGEATALAACGALVGILSGHALVWLTSARVEMAAGFIPDASPLWGFESGLLLLVTLAGALAGLVPAFAAYKTDVAPNLNPPV